MNKAYFTELAVYNQWADQKVIGWLTQLSDQQWEKEILSSFSSVKRTAVHIASAEKIWIDFWAGKTDPVYLSATFKGSKAELAAIWQEASEGMCQFIGKHSPEDLERPVSFRYPDGRTGQLRYYQTFAHSINHATYHRGQLVTLLRQVGFQDISSLDLATFYLTIADRSSC